MSRADLLNMLDRRRFTIRYATEKVSFLMALSKPVGYAQGEFHEIDGDALAALKAVTR